MDYVTGDSACSQAGREYDYLKIKKHGDTYGHYGTSDIAGQKILLMSNQMKAMAAMENPGMTGTQKQHLAT